MAGRISAVHTAPLGEHAWKLRPSCHWSLSYVHFSFVDSNLYPFTVINSKCVYNSLSESCASFYHIVTPGMWHRNQSEWALTTWNLSKPIMKPWKLKECCNGIETANRLKENLVLNVKKWDCRSAGKRWTTEQIDPDFSIQEKPLDFYQTPFIKMFQIETSKCEKQNKINP